MANKIDFGTTKLVEKLVACLNEGKIPWEKYWDTTKLFVSYATGHAYNWLNSIWLDKPGEYISPKKCIELGINFKGKKTYECFGVFPRIIKVKDKDGVEHEECIGRNVRMFRLFNVQELGIEPKYFGKDRVNKTVSESDRNEEIEKVIKAYCDRSGVKINEIEEENRAYYSPLGDYISIKRRDYFKSLNAFYGVLFHELCHSTGRKSRLNRFQQFEHHDYDREELVAEIGSAILRNHFGIEHKDMERNTMAYIQSWTRALEDKPDMIVWAAGKAEKAVKMILGIDTDEKAENE